MTANGEKKGEKEEGTNDPLNLENQTCLNASGGIAPDACNAWKLDKATIGSHPF